LPNNDIAYLLKFSSTVYDANAKVPSGLLSGNINQFGDYDQCLGASSPFDRYLRGKYCLVEIDPKFRDNNSRLYAMYNKLVNGGLFRGALQDVSRRK
jgi:hypothetical protein